MRATITVLLLLFFAATHAQDSTSRAGFYAQLNTSQLLITSSPVKHSSAVRSVGQWSGGGGVYWISAPRNLLQLELQLGYESTGSGREIYFNAGNSITRVYDRYRTLATVAMLRIQPRFSPRLAFGGGIKSNVVLRHEVRQRATLVNPPSLIIVSPAVKRVILSGVAELVVTFSKGEIGVQGWYAFTPVIYDNNTLVNVLGASLTVKAYIWR